MNQWANNKAGAGNGAGALSFHVGLPCGFSLTDVAARVRRPNRTPLIYSRAGSDTDEFSWLESWFRILELEKPIGDGLFGKRLPITQIARLV